MSDVIFLQNVRLSFPHLKEPHQSGPQATPAYSADFIMEKDADGYKKFMTLYSQLALSKWGEHANQVMQMINSDRKLRCYGNGDEKINKKTFVAYDGYAGKVYISAKRDTMPQMIRPDGSAIDPSNTMEWQTMARKLYGGCRVNAAVKPWVQDNKHGRGIRCDLIAVQFAADDEAFGEGEVDVSNMFGAVSGGDTVNDNPFGAVDVPDFMK